MRTELFISWRYLMTKRKEKFISLISVISIFGVAIGVTALIVVIAVMSGFDQDLRDKIVGNYSHLTLTTYRGTIDAKEYGQVREKILAHPRVQGVSPYCLGQALVKEGARLFAVSLKGIDPATETSVTRVSQYLIDGKLEGLEGNGIIVGRELASYLGLKTGSEVTLYSALGKKHTLTVSGVFASGMYDYDMNLVFTGITAAQEILGLPGSFSAVAIKLDNLYRARQVAGDLGRELGFTYSFKTWMEMNQNFFAALKLEKLTMFIILTLIVLVAAFNIASTLIVMVVEKTKDIGILKAIGMTSAQIRSIFTYQGLIIGGLGILFGAAGGIGICGLLKKYQFIQLPQDIYYLDTLPVRIVFWPDIALILGAALAITLVATVYPASKAAGLGPVEALRYE